MSALYYRFASLGRYIGRRGRLVVALTIATASAGAVAGPGFARTRQVAGRAAEPGGLTRDSRASGITARLVATRVGEYTAYHEPDGGSYPTGQVFVQIFVCATDTDMEGVNFEATLNGNSIGFSFGAWYGAPEECDASGIYYKTLTLVDGVNTLHYEYANLPYPTQVDAEFFKPVALKPIVNTSVHNGSALIRSRCVANCFDAVVSHTTPSYTSLDQARAVTLVYTSAQAQTRQSLEVEVSDTSDATFLPDRYSIQVKRNGNFLTFTNGATTLYFDYAPIARLAVQWSEDLPTGAYGYVVIVSSHYGSTVKADTNAVDILTLNERASPYGAGWSIAGLQRAGLSGSAAITDGDGSIAAFYGGPAWGGDFSTIVYRAAPDTINYERRYPDSTKAFFRTDGRLSYVDDRYGNRTSYRYDGSGRLTLITDPAGQTTTLAYDGNGKLDWIRDDAGNRTTQITINGSGDLTEIIDPTGGKPLQAMSYTDHRLDSYQNRRGGTWSFAYDFAGKLKSDSTPSVLAGGTSQRIGTSYVSQITEILVDPASGEGTSGTPADPVVPDTLGATITSPSGAVSRLFIHPSGAATKANRHWLGMWYYTLDDHGRPEGIDGPGGTYTSYHYNGVELDWIYDQRTQETRDFSYESTYHQVTRDSGRVVIRNWYGTNGRRDSTAINNQPATRFWYNARGQVDSIRAPDGMKTRIYRQTSGLLNTDSVVVGTRRTALAYDSRGRVTRRTDPLGNVDTTAYDDLNRITRVAGPLGHRIAYAYEDSLYLTKVTDAKGQIHRFHKNALGWDTSAVDPNGNSDRYAYSRDGNVTTWTNRRSQVTTFHYDPAGRMVLRVLSTGDTTWYAYTDTSRVATNAASIDVVRRSRSADSTIQTTTRGSDTYRVTSVYDPTNRDVVLTTARTTGTTWSRSLTYDYDARGALVDITQPGGHLTTFTYGADLQTERVALPTGDTIQYGYRPSQAVAVVQHSRTAVQTSQGVSYNHEGLVRIAEQLNAGRDTLTRYAYDALGRLTARRRHLANPACAAVDTTQELGTACYAAQAGVDSSLFSYDSVGNRTDNSALHDGANRVLRFGGDTLLYDLDGNLTRRYRLADSSVFNQRLYWNSVGHLDSVRTTVIGTTTPLRFGYDGWGRRIKKDDGTTVTYYVHAGEHVAAEYTASGLTGTYSYYPGTDKLHGLQLGSGKRYYYLTNGRADVTGLIDSVGAVVNRYRYGAFGGTEVAIDGVDQPYRFAGREYDEQSGLYFNRARYYSPDLGRFVSEDPFGLSGGINPYAYAQNNPCSYRDPSGLASEEDCPDIPQIPEGESVAENISKVLIASSVANASSAYAPGIMSPYLETAWYVGMVSPFGHWNYSAWDKTDHTTYEDGGNFNYGATAAAQGWSDGVILRGAGLAHVLRPGSANGKSWPLGGPPYGDDEKDQKAIRLGIQYFRNGCYLSKA
jgi:RHS repeat-associated protein